MHPVVDRRLVDERTIVAGTTARFVLLVSVLVVTSGAMVSAVLVSASGGDDYGCVLAAGVDPGQPFTEFDRALLEFSGAFRTCVARYQPYPPWWAPVAWCGVVVLAAAVLFAGLAAWKGRSGRVVELTGVHRGAELLREMQGLVAKARLVRAPRFVVEPSATSAGAVVFGSNRRPVVCLQGGLLVLERREPARFEAVVLHELGHIRNRDVTITYITVALWRVFLGAVLLPYTLWYGAVFLGWNRGAFWTRDEPFVVRSLILTVTMVVLVHLSRAEVLRSRELYADRAARQWGADPAGWSSAAPARPTLPARAIGAFVELWRTHPNWELRRSALSDTAVLHDLHSVPIFLTGVASVLINGQVRTLIPGVAASWWLDLAAAAAPALLAAVVMGIALWRAITHAVLIGSRVPTGLWAGATFGCGVAIGELVLSRVDVAGWLPARPGILVLVVLMMVGVGWWTGQSVALWARTWPGRTLRTPILLTVAAAGGLLCAVFVWWQGTGVVLANGFEWDPDAMRDLLLRALGGAPPRDPDALSLIAAAFAPVSFASDAFGPVAAALWIVPLLAWTIRPSSAAPRWARAASTGADGTDLAWTALPPLRRILLPSFVCGAACWPATTVLQQRLASGSSSSDAVNDVDLAVFGAWLSVILVAAAGLAGIRACTRVNELRLLVSLIGTGAATFVGVAAVLLQLVLGECAAPGTAWPSCGWDLPDGLSLIDLAVTPAVVIGSGAAFATAVVVGLVGWVRQHVRRPSHCAQPPTAAVVRGLLARRASVGALCVAALAMTIASVPPMPGNDLADVTFDSAELRLLPRQDEVPERTRALQVGAWYLFGGSELIDRQLDLATRFSATWHAAAANGGVIDNDVERPLCMELGRATEDADRYFPVPDPRLQARWRDMLNRRADAGAACVKALDENNGPMLEKSFEDMTATLQSLPTMLDDMEEATNRWRQPD